MGIYIKGFKPQDGMYVIKDGVIRKYKGKGGTVRPYELVEVKEPHGNLKDEREMLKFLEEEFLRLGKEAFDAKHKEESNE